MSVLVQDYWDDFKNIFPDWHLDPPTLFQIYLRFFEIIFLCKAPETLWQTLLCSILQLVFVSLGASRQQKKHDGSTPASYLPQPARNKIPMMLLLSEPHFGQLFSLLQQLSSFQPAQTSPVSWLYDIYLPFQGYKKEEGVFCMLPWMCSFLSWLHFLKHCVWCRIN